MEFYEKAVKAMENRPTRSIDPTKAMVSFRLIAQDGKELKMEISDPNSLYKIGECSIGGNTIYKDSLSTMEHPTANMNYKPKKRDAIREYQIAKREQNRQIMARQDRVLKNLNRRNEIMRAQREKDKVHETPSTYVEKMNFEDEFAHYHWDPYEQSTEDLETIKIEI